MFHRPRSPGTASPTLAYVAPFLIYIGLMGAAHLLGVPFSIAYPARLAFTLAAILVWSRGVVTLRATRLAASIAIGALVFAIWIAPDVLIGYRHHWLFENPVLGSLDSANAVQGNALLIICHFAGSALVVPVAEELFWRGWLMRWLLHHDFERVKPGTYSPLAFWVVAILFAIEHGSYWEVGLAAGIIYNCWMIRTGNLADCIVAHAATNTVLSIYVVTGGRWQYWP